MNENRFGKILNVVASATFPIPNSYSRFVGRVINPCRGAGFSQCPAGMKWVNLSRHLPLLLFCCQDAEAPAVRGRALGHSSECYFPRSPHSHSTKFVGHLCGAGHVAAKGLRSTVWMVRDCVHARSPDRDGASGPDMGSVG